VLVRGTTATPAASMPSGALKASPQGKQHLHARGRRRSQGGTPHAQSTGKEVEVVRLNLEDNSPLLQAGLHSTDIHSTDTNSTDIYSTDINSTGIHSTDIHSTDIHSTDIHSTDTDFKESGQ